MSAISIAGLTKDYGDVRANDDVTLDIRDGEIFGYLGPNGAGKTTTIRTLMGFQSPTSGTATVLGADIADEAALADARERIGYLPSNPAFDEEATGREVLDLHASLKGDSRRAELLDLFDVPVDREVRGYSTGQRQKLGLVQAFMHDPELLVMDEPTGGLDPLVQRTFNDFVRSEKAAGKTIFLSSHVLSEVRRVCDRIGIIREGEIVEVASVADVLQRAGKFVRARVAADVSREDVALDGVHELTVESVDGGYADLPMATAGETESGGGRRRVADDNALTGLTFTYTGSFDALVDYLACFHVLELDVEEAPLEQVFMRFYDGETPDVVETPGDDPESTAPSSAGTANDEDAMPAGTDPGRGGED
ncbi:ABC transporter ATP-binding protein [Halorubellus sp. PRR65]|uniref:ABC transporter ATP-binding protein n=1 Tax=Halorubellus sp. PRR65 TaxID=3098148 RepID=UPI002B2566C1|nr:ABC transporter ATP-binding protein [Halorubellus sp. PRR65]